MSNAFEVRANSQGPTITISSITNTAEGNSIKFTSAPEITIQLEDQTGLSENTVRFSIYLPNPPNGQSPDYYWTFPTGSPGYFTALEQNSGKITKAQVTAVINYVKDFSTQQQSPLNGIITSSSQKALYFYAEDENSNPASLLYDTVYCEYQSVAPSIKNEGLTSGVANPINTTITIQFNSDLAIDGDELIAYTVGSTGLASNHTVTARKVQSSGARSFMVAAAEGTNIYKVRLALTDHFGHALPVGIYRIMIKHPDYGIISSAKAAMAAPGMQ